MFELSLKPKEQVVVIDDDPSAQLQWELIGRKKGFQVRGFESYEAFQKDGAIMRSAIIDHHFDNSEIDGMEIVEKFRQAGFENLYLCTAEYWKPLIQEQARDRGVSICPKPIPRVVVRWETVDKAPSREVRSGGRYNVLVIDDDELMQVTWKALKEKLQIKELYLFPNLERFLESGVDPSLLDVAFVDLHLEGSWFDGDATIASLKERGVRHVVVASGEMGEKIPESLEELV